MCVRRGTSAAGSIAVEPRADGSTCGNYHGSRADREYSPIRHVQQSGQSDGGGGHGGRARGTRSHAVRAGHEHAMGARFSHGADCKHAGLEQRLHADVHVGRRDCHYRAGTADGDGAVTAAAGARSRLPGSVALTTKQLARVSHGIETLAAWHAQL